MQNVIAVISVYSQNRSSIDGLVYFARRKKIDLKCNSWRRGPKKRGARKRSLPGLLNYPEVQRSVTSRQPLRALPTDVFLCGGRAGGICRVAAPLARPA